MTFKDLLIYVLILLGGFMVGFCSQPETAIIERTECRIDTIRVVQPAEVRVDTFMREVRVPITKTETVTETLHVTDTLRVTDSIFVYLPFERKVYEDSTYHAVISGYKPVLEEIEVYRKETTIYQEINPPMFSPYITGSVGFNGDVSLGGGVFFRNKDAIGVEYGNRGFQVRYIHKF